MNSTLIAIILIGLPFAGMELFPLSYDQAKGHMTEFGVDYYFTGVFEGATIGINNDGRHNLTIRYIYENGETKSVNIGRQKMFTVVQNGTIEVTCANHFFEYMQIKIFKDFRERNLLFYSYEAQRILLGHF
jgi:hypothetical protein